MLSSASFVELSRCVWQRYQLCLLVLDVTCDLAFAMPVNHDMNVLPSLKKNWGEKKTSNLPD
jgi:hypothetical protein